MRVAPIPASSYKKVRYVMVFIAYIAVVVGAVGMGIGIAMGVHEERETKRKIAKLEAELAEAKEKLATKQ